jgi:hypothetical protein
MLSIWLTGKLTYSFHIENRHLSGQKRFGWATTVVDTNQQIPNQGHMHVEFGL